MPPPPPLLVLVVVGSVLFCSTSGNPPVGASPSSTDGAPSLATQLVDELFRFYRHVTRDAVKEPLAELAKTLADIQTAVAAVSGRLLSVEKVQLQQQTAQTDLTNRLDTQLQQQQQQQQTAQADLTSRLDTLLQQQQQQQQQQQEQQQTAQADLTNRLDTLLQQQQQQQTAQANLTDRFDTLLQQRQQRQQQQEEEEEATVNRAMVVQKRLIAIQSVVSHIAKMSLSKACGSDTDCSRMLPNTVCNEGGLCTCRAGFQWTANITCEKLPLLTEPCQHDADCQFHVQDAVCTSGACDCRGGYWSHGNAECRQVSTVALGGSCIGDQDCKSASLQKCVSGTCSCFTKTIGEYEFRLAGSTCLEGNVELRRTGNAWGLVCDDDWDSNDGKVICRSLGVRYEAVTVKSHYGSGTNFYMDEVDCGGSETTLLQCPYRGWGIHNCDRGEVAGVRCSNSGDPN